MSGFDQLEQQLLDAISRAGNTADRGERLGFARWRSRRALVFALAPLVLAAAAAATVIVIRPGESAAQKLFGRVLDATKHTPACRIVAFQHAVLSDAAPARGITATIPQLATVPHAPPSTAALRLAEEQGGTILVHTIREISFPGGIRVVMFVNRGRYPVEAISPTQCENARLATLTRLRPRPSAKLRATVAHTIETDLSTRPGVQTLALETIPSGQHGAPRYGSGAGAGIPVAPGTTLPTGIVSQASACYPAHPSQHTNDLPGHRHYRRSTRKDPASPQRQTRHAKPASPRPRRSVRIHAPPTSRPDHRHPTDRNRHNTQPRAGPRHHARTLTRHRRHRVTRPPPPTTITPPHRHCPPCSNRAIHKTAAPAPLAQSGTGNAPPARRHRPVARNGAACVSQARPSSSRARVTVAWMNSAFAFVYASRSLRNSCANARFNAPYRSAASR